jgi:predicted nucleotidyltransferase
LNPSPSVHPCDDPRSLDPLKAVLERQGDLLVCAYLFGSVARGEARAGSDLDITVLFETDPPQTLVSAIRARLVPR